MVSLGEGAGKSALVDKILGSLDLKPIPEGRDAHLSGEGVESQRYTNLGVVGPDSVELGSQRSPGYDGEGRLFDYGALVKGRDSYSYREAA